MISKSTVKSKKSHIQLDPNLAKIEIEIIDGDKNMLIPNVLRINAHGLENAKPLRNAQDGVTHFGCKRFYDDTTRKTAGELKTFGLFYNDYVFE